jgi:Zn-dependent membrane protease YugP
MLFGYFTFDWTILLVIPGLIISIWAQIKVSSTFNNYSRLTTARGLSGYGAARRILDANGLSHVKIEQIRGNLTDHYDPRANVIRLSESVYHATSPAAIGVAAHEAGHAIQYAKNYVPIKLRAGLVKVTNIGSALSMPLFFIGLLFAYYPLTILGIILYSLVTLFQLVTLPVEFNASSRAMEVLESSGILNQDELYASRKVLDAAAMTYVASTLVNLAYLLRMLALLRLFTRD